MDDLPLQELLLNFSIPDKVYSTNKITQGYINQAYAVLANEKPLYLLQRINHKVFPDVPALMQNLEQACKYLKDDDYYGLALIKTRQGKTYLETEVGEFWRLTTYVADSVAYDYTSDQNVALEAGKILAKFHLLLDEAPITDFKEVLPDFHNLGVRVTEFEQALSQASVKRKKKARRAEDFAIQTLRGLESMTLPSLPKRICHNDTKFNNFLFDKTTNKALCLIDLDTVMEGYLYCDFGDLVRTVVASASEDERDFDKIKFDKKLFKSLVSGLLDNQHPFTKEEIHALPYGVVIMPFLHGLRALTDYLNGDLYYRVSYAEQNLDRCLSLFEFTQKAKAELPFITETINEKV